MYIFESSLVEPVICQTYVDTIFSLCETMFKLCIASDCLCNIIGCIFQGMLNIFWNYAHEKRQSYTLTEALFSGANHKSLLCIATRGQRLLSYVLL